MIEFILGSIGIAMLIALFFIGPPNPPGPPARFA